MKKTFREFYNQKLLETPLPDTWDDALFDERVPFAKRVRYAMERAAKTGVGSSRVAFTIPYEGRQTVLKIAKNPKGMAQNEAEVEMLNDYYLRSLGIVIPMIDYDEKNNRPTWIHMELAGKAKDADFKKVCGGSLKDLMTYAVNITGKKGWFGGDASKILDDNEFASAFVDLVGSYDMPLGDFARLANWGVFDGQPVIIDMGLSNDVMKQHYS